MNEQEARLQICDIGRRIYQNGFVAANDGNISVRLAEDEFLCTPTGVSKGYLTPEMLCKVNGRNEVLSVGAGQKPSSEIKLHLSVYRARPDVNAVVHAHPPYATSFAIAGKPLTAPIMPEAVIFLGEVPIAPYGTPSTDELANSINPYLPHYDAILLENHGALSFSVDLTAAYFRMESLEFYAKLLFLSTQLGGPKLLSPEQVEKLYGIRRSFGVPGRHPAEYPPPEGLV